MSFPVFIEEAKALLAGAVDILGEDVREWRRLSLGERVRRAQGVRAVHFFQGRVKLLELLRLGRGGRKVIVHFIGSDVVRLREGRAKKRWEARLASRWVTMAAVAPHLVDELGEIGIRASLLPFVTRTVNADPAAIRWPAAPPWRFLTYVPPERKDYYGLPTILEIARRTPEAEFLLLALEPADLPDSTPPNVEPLGWRDDVAELLPTVHGVLRLTEHDGLPNLVVEALSFGRHVVFSGRFPATIHASTPVRAAAAVRKVMAEAGPNRAGFRTVTENLSRDRIRAGFLALYGP